MNAFIAVRPTPYFAENDESGNYTNRVVARGSYKVVVWHKGGRQRTAAESNYMLSL